MQCVTRTLMTRRSMRVISWESAIMKSFAVGKEIQDVTMETIALMDADDAELITVYYGEDTKPKMQKNWNRH